LRVRVMWVVRADEMVGLAWISRHNITQYHRIS
jgi:hypothetical protein